MNHSLWKRSIYLCRGPIGYNELEALLLGTLRERRDFLSREFVDWELRQKCKRRFWIQTSLNNGPVGIMVGGPFSGDLDR